ncbi:MULTISPECIES: YciI family protein [Ramlibacter]|uniref:YCII-related domain-containing protein n=1 Tax=Ramlibacter pinisoli TaxID=2682844 RepID=A0A6N8IVS6_9BURK|nr:MULTISPECIES: YciI family protein [Ramlibacter]MBA2960981.1 hypothetical protein [Ramlibacter sp. CGMCC 1.13660]MVQ30927.1 hypothetical protein [Ramlibacter pinisoli]
MTQPGIHSEFLVLSRGQWDEDKSPDEIQAAIDAFYGWHEALVEQGLARPGQRLGPEGRVVSRQAIVDGPFAEAKEVVGGYWFMIAASLDEAAALLAGNPCLACGLQMEVRPLDPERASAHVQASETPASRRRP